MIESRKKIRPSIVHRRLSSPAVIKATLRQVGYSRSAIFSALVNLETVGLIRRRCAPDKDQVRGGPWFRPQPAPSLCEDERAGSRKGTAAAK